MARRRSVEDLAWLALGPAALLLWATLSWLAPLVDGAYPDPSIVLFPEWSPLRNPEPLEDTRFLLAIAAAPLYAGLVGAIGRAQPPRRTLDPAVIAVQLVTVGFTAWCVAAQHSVPQIYEDYFDPTLIPLGDLIAGAAIGAASVAAALAWDGGRLAGARRALGRIEAHPRWAFAAAVGLTALWLLPGLFTDSNVGVAGINPPGHIALQFEDYLAVANGRTPLADLITTYASVLPLAIGPLLPLFDSSMTFFTLLMTALSLIALASVYAAFRAVTRRSWAALALYVPFVGLSLLPWASDVVPGVEGGLQRESNGTSFALLPDRYLGPLLLAWLCARWVSRRSPPLWSLYLVAGLTVLNNAEFGLPCLIALTVAVTAALATDNETSWRKSLGPQAARAAAGLLGAFALVSAVTLIRAGQVPDLGLLLYWSRTFARAAYGLEPMSAIGLHWVLYLTYAAALVTAVVRLRRGAPDRTLTAMLLYAGAFGLATAPYFAGRSQGFQLIGLFPAWGLALALLAWTSALALRSCAGDRVALRRLLVPAFAALAGLGTMAATLAQFPPPWRQAERIALERPAAFALTDQQRFVEARTGPGEAILLIGTPLDHRVAERAGVENVSPVSGAFGLLSTREVDRSLDALSESGGRKAFVAVPPASFSPLTGGIRAHLEAALAERGYRKLATDPASGVALWERR